LLQHCCPLHAIMPAGHDEHDLDYWGSPPRTKDGKPVMVDMRMNLVNLTEVDTIRGTCFAKIHIMYYWTDERMIGWSALQLPAKLWGPRLWVTNARPEMEEANLEFVMVDKQAGRLKRGRSYTGVFDDLQDLTDFPFDINDVELKWLTWCNWMTYDETHKGTHPTGVSYRLRPVVPGAGEGNWIDMRWNGDLPEWNMEGVTTVLSERPPNAQGQCGTDFLISFVVSRYAMFYFWKVLVPVYLVFMLSLATYSLPIDSVDDRQALIGTYFIAAFAMLHVVGSYLPKTNFLTTIDKTIVLSTVLCAGLGILTPVISRQEHYVNDLVWAGTIGIYVLGQLFVFVPPFLRRRKALRELTKKGQDGISSVTSTYSLLGEQQQQGDEIGYHTLQELVGPPAK